MKILTDKVYLKGQEFIVNNWPGEPKAKDLDPDIYSQGHINDRTNHYRAALNRAIEEGYVVQTHFYELLPTQDPLTARSHQFYTLPEPREFECTEFDIFKIATLLPKEEIKPAPLGEGKPYGPDEENQYWKDYGDHLKNPESLGESSEEQKRRHDRIFEIAEKLWIKWGLILEDRGTRMTKDLFTLAIQDKLLKEIHSPKSEPPDQKTIWYRKLERKLQLIQSGEMTLDEYIHEVQHRIATRLEKSSEAPEEQEELWKLAVSFIMDSHDAGLNYLISNLKDSFTIHRKRD